MSKNTGPSITKQPVFRPELTKPISMEDLRAAQLAFYNALQDRQIYFATVEDDNKFYESMSLFLEESFNWPDYHSYN
jgi:hypothetical protein